MRYCIYYTLLGQEDSMNVDSAMRRNEEILAMLHDSNFSNISYSKIYKSGEYSPRKKVSDCIWELFQRLKNVVKILKKKIIVLKDCIVLYSYNGIVRRYIYSIWNRESDERLFDGYFRTYNKLYLYIKTMRERKNK